MGALTAWGGAVLAWWVNLFTRFMALPEAYAWGRRTFIVALGVSFFAAVSVCISSLYGAVASALSSGGGGSYGQLWSFFLMGLGMVIPSNAAVVLACMFSVWAACVAYRLKLEGLRW